MTISNKMSLKIRSLSKNLIVFNYNFFISYLSFSDKYRIGTVFWTISRLYENINEIYLSRNIMHTIISRYRCM